MHILYIITGHKILFYCYKRRTENTLARCFIFVEEQSENNNATNVNLDQVLTTQHHFDQFTLYFLSFDLLNVLLSNQPAGIKL